MDIQTTVLPSFFMRYFVNLVTQMLTYLGKKLDYTCIAEGTVLIVKFDCVFLFLQCHLRPEEFS